MSKIIFAASLTVAIASAASSLAQEPAAAAKEIAYTQSIEKRTQDILSALNLHEGVKRASVHDAIIAQYRGLKAWHDANDVGLNDLTKRLGQAKADEGQTLRAELAELKSSLKALHDAFLVRLSKDLSHEQVEQVKDKLTYNVVHVTYNAYGQMLPNLTAPQKERILAMLKEAREEAMDGGSADEKHAVFGRYKGRINNYLAAEGYDLQTASKELAEKLKAQQSAPKTRP